MSIIRAVVLTALALSLVACDSDPDDTQAVCTTEATFSSLRTTYFERSCTFGDCHNSVDRAGELDLSETNTGLYDQLVNTTANDENAGPRGKLRVVPMDPAASFMVQKVEGTMAADEGKLMPEGADEVVDPDCGVAKLKEWITAGALNN